MSDLKSLQDEVDEYLAQFKDGYWSPLEILARLSEETGELAREINHSYGPKKKKPEEPDGSISHELADIIFVVVSMANKLDIDLDQAWGEVMARYRTRDKHRWERV